jgi:hypothetical protein
MSDIDYYQYVKILSSPATRAMEVSGTVGIVVGATGTDPECYAVLVRGQTYMIGSSDIEPTGKRASRDDLYTSESIRVPREYGPEH